MACMFKTSSGSTYQFDLQNRLICGGKLGMNPVQFIPEKSQIFVGNPALIYLQNGKLLRTSTVASLI